MSLSVIGALMLGEKKSKFNNSDKRIIIIIIILLSLPASRFSLLCIQFTGLK